MATSAKARRWFQRWLLAVELILLLLLVVGGCYSKQNYHVLSSPAEDKVLSKCNVVVEGQIAFVRRRTLTTWGQKLWQTVFFCFPYAGEPDGPYRFDAAIDIDKVLKGDPNMPRRLEIKNCRPLTREESGRFWEFFPDNLRIRLGYNHKIGDKFTNLTVVPLELVPTTQPH